MVAGRGTATFCFAYRFFTRNDLLSRRVTRIHHPPTPPSNPLYDFGPPAGGTELHTQHAEQGYELQADVLNCATSANLFL